MERKNYWHCPECGGLNVVTRIWVDANLTVNDPNYVWDEENPSYCNDCGRDVFLEYGPASGGRIRQQLSIL